MKHGEIILLVNDPAKNTVYFGTNSNLQHIADQKISFDRTFQYCTKYFTQLFTDNAIKNRYYVPLIFSLLPCKQSATYEKMLSNF